jgi:soluble lytic murein transglycosylase
VERPPDPQDPRGEAGPVHGQDVRLNQPDVGKGDEQGTGRRRLRPLLPVFLVLALGLWLAGSDRFWDVFSPVTHKDQLYRLAGEYKIDPLLLAAIVRHESHFNPFAESRSGAIGLMQLMPATAEEAARELSVDYQSVEDLYRDDINLQLGTHHFARLLKAFKGDTLAALAAYNAGAAKVRAWRLPPPGTPESERVVAIPIDETRAYVDRVLGSYRFFKRIQRFKRSLQGLT